SAAARIGRRPFRSDFIAAASGRESGAGEHTMKLPATLSKIDPRWVVCPAFWIGAALAAARIILGHPPLIYALVWWLISFVLFMTLMNGRVRIQNKLREWATDFKQLHLWTKLALTSDRDAEATAAMAHQQHFLAGRLMSPLNIFGALPMYAA